MAITLRGTVAVRAFEEDAARVVGDQVVLGEHVVARLEQQADRGEAAIADEPVAAEDDALRVHERGAGGAVLERGCPRRGCRPRTCSAGRSAGRARLCRESRRATTTGCRSRRGRPTISLPESGSRWRVPDVDAGALLAGRPCRDAAITALRSTARRPPRAGRCRRACRDPAVADVTRGAATWMPEESRPRSPPPRPSMSKPSMVTSAARMRTTLPAPDPTRRGRPCPTRRRAIDDEIAVVGPGRTTMTRPAAARVDRACSGETAGGAGGPSSAAGWAAPALCRRGRRRRRAAAGDGSAPAWSARHGAAVATAGRARHPRQRARRQPPAGGDRHRVGAGPRVGVHLEVRDLLIAEHRRHERLDLHRRRRRQVVAVAIQLVAERPERERAEVDEQHDRTSTSADIVAVHRRRRNSRPKRRSRTAST